MKIKVFFVLLISSLLAACAGTTIVLLPDPSGKVGEVEIASKDGTTVLTNANESAQTTKYGQALSKPIQLSDEKVNDMFAKTLAKEPTPPLHFTLYFPTNTADINAETNAKLSIVYAAIEQRKSCDISVIGHCDRVDEDNYNELLSLVRAEKISQVLVKLGIKKHCMDIRYYGENDPAIPTADNVDEPRNRRVEVEIR